MKYTMNIIKKKSIGWRVWWRGLEKVEGCK
jgi:hypothetical protein